MGTLTKTTPRKDLLKKRLTISTVSTILPLFIKNIKVLEWEKWGTSNLDNFCPFETLHTFYSRSSWIENQSNMPNTFPSGYVYDVRWMPICHQPENHKGKTLSYMKYNSDYATTWHLALVAIHSKKKCLMVWDTKSQSWGEFKIKDKYLEKLLQSWIDW